jgi:hypothetical protein
MLNHIGFFMIQSKSQSFNSNQGVHRTGNFIINDNITGEITHTQTLPLVSQGKPTPRTSPNLPLTVHGTVHKVTANGEITEIIAVKLVLGGKIDKDVPRIITLNTSQLDSYTLQAI